MLSVIVPTYCMTPETRDLAQDNLARICDVATVEYELVVVDNASTFPPTFVRARFPENYGVAPAWNEGRRWANGDVLAFVTCTTRVEPGWDAKLVAVATSGRYIAMPYTNGEKPYGLGITGWCFVVTRALADEIGPFDETFVPVQYEDTDWFHRAIYQHGVELVNVPGANVTRAAGKQTLATAPWGKRQNLIHMANRFRYAWKHDLDPNDVPPFWKTTLRDVVPARRSVATIGRRFWRRSWRPIFRCRCPRSRRRVGLTTKTPTPIGNSTRRWTAGSMSPTTRSSSASSWAWIIVTGWCRPCRRSVSSVRVNRARTNGTSTAIMATRRRR